MFVGMDGTWYEAVCGRVGMGTSVERCVELRVISIHMQLSTLLCTTFANSGYYVMFN